MLVHLGGLVDEVAGQEGMDRWGRVQAVSALAFKVVLEKRWFSERRWFSLSIFMFVFILFINYRFSGSFVGRGAYSIVGRAC